MNLGDYIKGRRKGPQAQRTEVEAMRDRLLADAIEGYDKVAGDHDAVLSRLRARVAEREKGATPLRGSVREPDRRWRTIYRVVAAAVVFIGLVTGAFLFVPNDVPLPKELATHRAPTLKDSLHRTAPADRKSEIADNARRETSRNQLPAIATDELPAIATVTESAKERRHHEAAPKQEVNIVANILEDIEQAEQRGVAEEVAFADFAEAPQEQMPALPIADEQRITADHTTEAVVASASDSKGSASFSVLNPDTTKSLDEVVVVAYGVAKKRNQTDRTATSNGSGAIASDTAAIVADTTTTAQWRSYLARETAAFMATGGATGRVILQFEVDKQGRPHRIDAIESSSPKLLREARRILRNGPDWAPAAGKRRLEVRFE